MSTRTIEVTTGKTTKHADNVTFDPAHMPVAREVVERNTLHAEENFIMSRKAGKKLSVGKNPETGESFQHFGLQLDGKVVNFFLYGIGARPGKMFRGKAQIMTKKLQNDDGTFEEHIYIDVTATDEDPNHQLKFFNKLDAKRDLPNLDDDAVIIEGFTNIVGTMAMVPHVHVPYLPKHLRK